MSVRKAYGNSDEHYGAPPRIYNVSSSPKAISIKSPTIGIKSPILPNKNGFSSRTAKALYNTEKKLQPLDKTLSMDTSNPSPPNKKTVKEITYMEEDFGPDFLLPSNGGYNPKRKTMYVEEEESPDKIYQPSSPSKPKKPKSFSTYAKML